jgi:large subunit ribosomal protein L23
MDLKIYDIIKGPVVTDKAVKLNKSLKKLVIRVHSAANKQQIKEALEKIFNVKVEEINIVVRKGKRISFKRIQSVKPLVKRAIVTLKEGHVIGALDQSRAIAPLEETLPQQD